MSFKYFRFYLSEATFYDENQRLEFQEKGQKKLESTKNLGFIRAAFDLGLVCT